MMVPGGIPSQQGPQRPGQETLTYPIPMSFSFARPMVVVYIISPVEARIPSRRSIRAFNPLDFDTYPTENSPPVIARL
jgi:hypothetical protein